MGQNKEIKFAFVIDERSAQQAKRVIMDLISSAQQLAKTLAGATGGGGGLIAGAVGGGQTQGTMISNLQAPKPGPNGANKGLAQVFVDNANNLKGLANASRDSMRIMSDGIKRAVEEQKRSIGDLDTTLARLAKRYDDLKGREKGLMSAYVGSGMTPDAARAHFEGKLGSIEAQTVQANSDRSQQQQRLSTLAGMGFGGSGGGGGGDIPPYQSWGDRYGNSAFGQRFPLRNAQGDLFRGGVVGGAIAGGVLAGAQEMIAQPFDFVTQQARQAQALGTVGVATKHGDLRYAAAMMQVMRDRDKRDEFLLTGDQGISTGITATGGAVVGVLKGDVNAPGNIARGLEGINSTQKERLRSYMDQQIQGDPSFFAHLDKFQGEAGMRMSAMRRMGYGEMNLSSAIAAAGASGQGLGDISGAFESVRGGGRGFASSALWQALRAQRGGMDMGAAGDLLSAGAAGGSSSQLLAGLTTNMDPVAAERLAGALSGAMRSSGFGPTSGLGLAGAMSYGLGGNGAMDAFQAQQRAAAMPSLGAFLGGSGDGLAAGINALSANNIVGPGGDLYKVNALSQLGSDPAAMYDAMIGRISPGLAAMGVTQGDAQSMFKETMTRNLRSRFIDQGAAATTPATRAMQKLVTDYNGDIGAYMDGEMVAGTSQDKLLTELGAGMNAIMPQTVGTASQGKEIASMLAGAGTTGNFLGKGLGDAAGRSAAREYESNKLAGGEKDFKEFLASNREDLKQLSQDLMEFGKLFTRMGNVDQGADAAAKSLVALADAADKLTLKYGGVTPERAQADLNAARRTAQAAMEQSKAGPKYNATALRALKSQYDANPSGVSPSGQAALRSAGMIK